MARFLLYTSPAPGHIFPPVATLDALRRRGHEIAIRTSAAGLGTLEKVGFSPRAIDPRIDAIPAEDWKARTSIGAIRALLEAFDARAELELDDMRTAIEDERPDALWIDANATGAAAVAEGSDLPWAHYVPYPWPLPGRGVPSFGPGFAPSEGVLARLRDGATEQVKTLAYASARKRMNARRARLGLPRLDRYEELLLASDSVVQFSAEPFEYPREWPAKVRLVGPALWEPPSDEPAWLKNEERPVILVTASTEFQDDSKLIRTTLQAFADTPYLVVATTAAHDPADFDAPANARVESFVPHGPILRRAAAAISHGGMGTTQKSLAAGVPVCVAAFMRDQFEVGRRVEHSGGGTFIPARRVDPGRLRTAVEGAIACRRGAERVAAAFERAGGAEAAATVLEGLTLSPAASPRD